MERLPSSRNRTPAVVVGACSHGIAIARTLGRRGIPVFSLESNSNLPGVRSRFTTILPAADINGPPLIADLLEHRRRFDEDPVLYLTNDNMVRTMAGAWDEIRSRYRILWPDPDVVRRLLDKQHIESIASQSGLGYPRSFMVSGVADLNRLRPELSFPMILKPTKPLSAFKALKVEGEDELADYLQRYESSIGQFLLQEWITGANSSIHFVNFYFDGEGKPLATFVGRKVRSYPRDLGGACSAEPVDRPDIVAEASRFFRSVPVRGPASLEIKEDDRGRRFVIEPTIGRFDFYILCCMTNGVDFPYLSYAYLTEHYRVPSAQRPGRGRMWVDFENDVPSLLGSLGTPEGGRELLQFVFRRKAFALWAWDDPMPSVLEWPKSVWRYLTRATHVLSRMLGGRS